MRMPANAIAREAADKGLLSFRVGLLRRVGWRLAAIVGMLMGFGTGLSILLYAYLKAFVCFESYDDEGFFLMTTRHILDGYRLYDEVVTFYGPFYYFARWLLHTALGVSNTNDVQRLFMVAFQACTAVLYGIVTWRATGRVALGMVAALLAAPHVARCQNPGHPEILCSMLVAALPLIGDVARPGRAVAAMSGLGLACAALFLTKINVGVYATLGVLVAATARRAPDRRVAIVGMGMATAAVALPLVMLRHDLSTRWGQIYLAIILLPTLAYLVVARRRAGAVNWGSLMAFSAAFAGFVLLLLAFTWMRGSTLRGLIHSTVVVPQRLISILKRAPIVSPAGAAWSLASLCLALAYMAGRSGYRRLMQASVASILSLKALALSIGFAVAVTHGTNISRVGITSSLLNFGPGLLWMLLACPLPGRRGASLLRPILVATTLIGLLVPFPIPGTQVFTTTLPFVPATIIGLGDLLDAAERSTAMRWVKPALRWVPLVMWLCLFGIFAQQTLRVSQFYRRPGAIQTKLAGMARLRLEEQKSATYRWLTTNLARYADRCLCTVGTPSIHAWSGVNPPNQLVVPNNLRVFDEAQLRSLTEAIEIFPRFVLIRHLKCFYYAPFDDTKDATPTLRWFDTHFAVVGEVDGFEFMVRRDRPRPPLLDCARPLPPLEAECLGHKAIDGRRTFALDLEALPGAVVDRVSVADAEGIRALADSTVAAGPASLLVSDRDRPTAAAPAPGRGLAIDLSNPRRLVFSVDGRCELDRARFPVVRLHSRDGRKLVSLPFLEPPGGRKPEKPR
jgi:hypothetical protein